MAHGFFCFVEKSNFVRQRMFRYSRCPSELEWRQLRSSPIRIFKREAERSQTEIRSPIITETPININNKQHTMFLDDEQEDEQEELGEEDEEEYRYPSDEEEEEVVTETKESHAASNTVAIAKVIPPAAGGGGATAASAASSAPASAYSIGGEDSESGAASASLTPPPIFISSSFGSGGVVGGSHVSGSLITSSPMQLGRKGSMGTNREIGVKGESGEYIGMSQYDLRLSQEKITEEVMSLLEISKDQASVLLLHFKWNQESLKDKYFEDPEATLRVAGAMQVNDILHLDMTRKGEQVICLISDEEVIFEESFSMGCTTSAHPEDHRFSLKAWREYLSCKIADGPQCIFTKCPMDGCNCVISPSVWRTVLTCRTLLDAPNVTKAIASVVTPSPLRINSGVGHSSKLVILSSSVSSGHSVSTDVTTSTEKVVPSTPLEALKGIATVDPEYLQKLEKYETFLNSSFVEMNSRMKWCPRANCTYAVMAMGSVLEVKCCSCKYIFCFRCHNEGHAPASCKVLKEWLEKCTNESETANWILANTKTCPKCGTRIEKNQGCNHMTCTRCRHEFCWICSNPWETHGSSTGGYYDCNKFQDKQKSETEDDAAKAKRELDRYLFHYKRYHGHEMSLKFAEKQRIEAEKKMDEIQSKDKHGGWSDVDYLAQAVEQLIECRRVLKYTYVHAFYLEEGPLKTLFEHNQMMLESNTEKLSELTERPIEKLNRADVVNFTRVTGNFVRSLLDQVMTSDFAFNSGAAMVAPKAELKALEPAKKVTKRGFSGS